MALSNGHDPPARANPDSAASKALREQSRELRQESRMLLATVRKTVENSEAAIGRARMISAWVASRVKQWHASLKH